MRRLGFTIGLVLAALAWLSIRAQPAGAHSLLVRSDPPSDARLVTPPARVTAWFTEPLDAAVSTLRVVDGVGQRADLGQMEFTPADPTRMAVALRTDLGPGFYTVTWETLSQIDGHIWFGSFDFTVLNPDGSLPGGPRPAPASTRQSPVGLFESAWTKFVGLAAAVTLVGSLAFGLIVAPAAVAALPDKEATQARAIISATTTRLVITALAMLALVAAVELLLQSAQLAGIGAGRTVLATAWGGRWVQRQVALGLATLAVAFYLGLRRRNPGPATACRWVALAAGIIYLLLVAAASHGAAVPAGAFWATLFDFVHLVAAAVWIGGLVQLGLLIDGSRRAVDSPSRPLLLAATLQRFSLLAGASVAVLLASGLLNALVQVPSWRALVETAYGRVLLAKLALLVPLLAVAAINAVLLRPRLVRSPADVNAAGEIGRQLMYLVTLETVLAVAVVLITAALAQYPSARSQVATATAAVRADTASSEATGRGNDAVAPAAGRDPFASPLAHGNWGTVLGVGMAVAGVLGWLWIGQHRNLDVEVRKTLRTVALGLPAVGLAIAAATVAPREQPSGQAGVARAPAAPEPQPSAAPSPPQGDGAAAAPAPFTAQVALRYQTAADRSVLLEIAPFQPGANTFRVTVLDATRRPVGAGAIRLRFSRLEQEGEPREVAATPVPERRSFVAETPLTETGWWQIDVDVDGAPAVSFYQRLDDPARAPLAFAPPDYASDPDAEALFRQALRRYEGLASVRWREELTSGLLAPTGIGASVVTTGEAEAPDRLHIHARSPGFSDYELYRIGGRSCTTATGRPWQCVGGEPERAFDLDYQRAATAFRFGRREVVDGELSRVLLFYNPTQPAWYAWWVGEETGYLRRQAMVAAGHFMLTRYFDHNEPIGIAMPP